MDKGAIAIPIRDHRKSLSVETRAPWDKVIHDRVMDYVSPYKVIALYSAMLGEVDTYGIMETLFWDETKIIGVPKIGDDDMMKFYRIRSFKELKAGYFNVLEPIGDEEVVPELVLTPLSAFNDECYRIGYGGGYYDRYFADHQCMKIGLAYSFQYVDIEFQETFDIACNMIITEKELYYETSIQDGL